MGVFSWGNKMAKPTFFHNIFHKNASRQKNNYLSNILVYSSGPLGLPETRFLDLFGIQNFSEKVSLFCCFKVFLFIFGVFLKRGTDRFGINTPPSCSPLQSAPGSVPYSLVGIRLENPVCPRGLLSKVYGGL